MMETTLKLKDALNVIAPAMGYDKDALLLSFSILDDIFAELVKQKIFEVQVNRDEMLYIVRFMTANAQGDKDGMTYLRTGEVDMLFGVKLILEA